MVHTARSFLLGVPRLTWALRHVVHSYPERQPSNRRTLGQTFRARLRPPAEQGTGSATGISFPRHICRRPLTLGYDGEAVILVDDPLDVTDEVIRHDRELP